MHKVKGIEYDAVLIPPSLSNFAMKSTIDTKPNINDVFEEERRLYYVAYTRAKYKLIVIKWKKENALYNTIPEPIEIFTPEETKDKMGILMEEGIDKFTLYWGATNFGGNSFSMIESNVRLGDKVTLKRRSQINQNGSQFYIWEAFVNNKKVSKLSNNITNNLPDIDKISDLLVSSIYVHTYEETERSDAEWIDKGRPFERQRPYSAQWNEESKNRGYIYLIDFSGYGKIIN
jgi:ATP-dependent DNA helicase RecQ